MAEPRPDRLDRESLEGLQRAAMRRWRDSDALAFADPRGWLDLDTQPDSTIRVALGHDTPGAITVGPVKADGRRPDLCWESEVLPFDDNSVDEITVGAWWPRLGPELTRTLRNGGCVRLELGDVPHPFGPLERHGFAQDPDGRYRLMSRTLTLADVAPPNEKEIVLGERVIRSPRMPEG